MCTPHRALLGHEAMNKGIRRNSIHRVCVEMCGVVTCKLMDQWTMSLTSLGRHPNYFGEFLFHCGISCLSCIYYNSGWTGLLRKLWVSSRVTSLEEWEPWNSGLLLPCCLRCMGISGTPIQVAACVPISGFSQPAPAVQSRRHSRVSTGLYRLVVASCGFLWPVMAC